MTYAEWLSASRAASVKVSEAQETADDVEGQRPAFSVDRNECGASEAVPVAMVLNENDYAHVVALHGRELTLKEFDRLVMWAVTTFDLPWRRLA